MSDTTFAGPEPSEATAPGDLDSLLGGQSEQSAPAETTEEASKPRRKTTTRRRSKVERPKEPLYNATQVAQIIDFVVNFDEAEETLRKRFFAAFGWPADTTADGLKVAWALPENPQDIAAFVLFEEFVNEVWSGDLGFSETIALIRRFEEVEVNVLDSFLVVVNAFVPAGSEVERASSIADTIQSAVLAVNAIQNRDEVNSAREWVRDLFSIWPGE